MTVTVCLSACLSLPQAEEIRKLAGKRDTFGQCGPCVGGMKCRMLRDNMEDEKMYSLDLKSAADAEGNTYSVCVGKSKQGENSLLQFPCAAVEF